MPDSLDFRVLERLSPLPTATFFEELILDESEKIARELFGKKEYVMIERDTGGNLILHYQGDSNRESPKGLAFVVHADHPAFHLTPLRESGLAEAKMMGGLHPENVIGAKVNLNRIEDGQAVSVKGHIVRALDIADGNPSQRYIVQSEGDNDYDFATLSLPRLQVIGKNNPIIRAPVLDDIASIGMSYEALKRVVDDKLDVDVYVVIHRAEEVGFIGAYEVAISNRMPKETYVISVETSSINAKLDRNDSNQKKVKIAEVGGGIIVRTGDRMVGGYDNAANHLLHTAALDLPTQNIQEHLMFGGACEAALYYAMGYRAGGVCIPLLNWHNGVLDDGISREGVSKSDFHAGTALLYQAAQKLSSDRRLNRSLSRPYIKPELHKLVEKVGQWHKTYRELKFI